MSIKKHTGDTKSASLDDFVRSRGEIGHDVSVYGPHAAYICYLLSQVIKKIFASSNIKELKKRYFYIGKCLLYLFS